MAGCKLHGSARTAKAFCLVAVCFAVSCVASSELPSPSPTSTVTKPTPQASESPVTWFQAHGVSFWNECHGLVVGTVRCRHCTHHDTGIVYATKDGGSSWTVALRRGHIATDVTTTGRGIALLNVDNRLLRTTDKGRHWTTLGHSRIGNFSFVNPRIGWGIRPSTLDGKLVSTTDRGHTWASMKDPCGALRHFDGPTGFRRSSAKYLTDVSFPSRLDGWVLCHGDGAAGSAPVAVYETGDGGVTWTKKVAEWDAEPGGLQFLHDGRGWRWPFGGGYVERSPNGGATWHQGGSFGPVASRGSVWFVSPEIGYAVSDRQLYRSTDGGKTWSVVTHAFSV
jgi:photosystem II stability/assembly factor-like uncharacterized protein